MPYDGGDLYVKVELYINGAFVEVTTRARGGRAASGVEINRGRGTGALQAESATCSLTLGNDDGFVTEGNPFSPWHPYIGRGCRIRVSIADVAVSDVVRFDGEIDTIVAVYPGGSDSSVRITATGILGGQLGLGADPLRSPMFRTMTGISADGYAPAWYWAMEDDSGALTFASGLPGGAPMTFSTGVSPSADSSMAGSPALPTFDAEASATTPALIYTDTGKWVVKFAVNIAAEPAAETVYAEILTAPGGSSTRTTVSIVPGSPASVRVQRYDASGALLPLMTVTEPLSSPASPTEAEFFGQWAMITVASEAVGADIATVLGVATADAPGALGTTTTNTTGTHTRLTAVSLKADTACSFGHLGIYTDAAIVTSTSDWGHEALDGWDGELASDRIERLCREEGIACTISAVSLQRMGPQSVDTLAELLIECEAVDQGLLSDGGSGGGLAYYGLSGMTNQDASLAVTSGSLDVDVAPVWDNRNVRNDVTMSRPGGSSARRTDEAHIARTRHRIKGSGSVNVETDEQLPDQAGWRVNVGTADGPRYNGVGINLRNSHGRLLADAVLALEMGDRFTAAEAALPPQHPPGGIDGLVVGWREELDKDRWVFAPNVVPYAPYNIAVYGTDPGGVVSRYGARDTTLAEDLTDSDTSWLVDTGIDTWATTDGHPAAFPFDIDAGGLTYACGAINPAFLDTCSRTVANGLGTSDSGHAWTTSGGVAADYSVSAGTGRMQIAFAAVGLKQAQAGDTYGNVTYVGQVRPGVVASGAPIDQGLLVRRDSVGNSAHEALVRFETSGVIALRVNKVVSGAASNIAANAVGAAYSSGSIFWIKVQIVGTSIRVRAWNTASDEPDVWHLDFTDASVTAAGQVGVVCRVQSGNTNVPVSPQWDALETLNPLTFTVTRLATDKAHSTGEQVTVTDTGRYAL